MIFFSLLISIILLTGLPQDNRGYILQVGEKAPLFHLHDQDIPFIEQNTGKVIMLQFTANWCSVCLKEMPFIENEIWQIHQNNPDFVLIALAKDTENRPQRENEIKIMINKTGVTYPIITDYHSKIFELFAEKKAGVTRNIIIDQNGEIAFLTRLFDHEEFNEMRTVIDKLLKKKH